MPALSVIVPAYSNATSVERAVAALHAAAAAVDGGAEIVVVMNRRIDGLGLGPDTRVLTAHGNLGFAAGVMRGVRETTGEWIAVVNDDCVVAPEALAAALRTGSAAPEIGSVAGLVLFADRPSIVNAAGIVVDVLGVAAERLVGAPASAAARSGDVFGCSGAFALYRRRMLDEVGGFDESFFAYLEDADIAWRAQAAGWRCVFEPAAHAVHAHSSVLGHGSHRKHFLVGRNRVRMLAKNATAAQLIRYGVAIVLYDVAYVAYAAARHRTLAPLLGRVAGLREWRRYRSVGAATRAPVRLARPQGLGAARRRDRVYRG